MKFYHWKEFVANTGKELNGTSKIVHHSSGISDIEYYTAYIEFAYLKEKLTIQQGFHKHDYENGKFAKLEFNYSFPNRNNFKLTINNRDFLNKLFSFHRVLVKNEAFNQGFTLKSTNERRARNVFEDKYIQQFFLENPLLTFVIETQNSITTLKLNYLDASNLDTTQLASIINLFKRIIDRVLE